MKGRPQIIYSLSVAAMLTSAVSCESIFRASENGTIRMAFLQDALIQTRAGISPSDTNSFILRVTDSKGRTVYDGTYGASPESMMVNPGSYTVKVMSSEFTAPAFSSPQYGDTQTVTVKSGEATCVTLVCRQINAGIRLNIDSGFLSAYPDGTLHLKSDDGKLLYSYSEKRIAYFNPGTVSLMLSNGGRDEILLSRSLASQEVYTLNISIAEGTTGSPSSPKNVIKVQLDTARNWVTENFTLGGSSDKGSGIDNPYSVAEARSLAGKKDVWVYGYVVGGDLSSSKASFSAPFTSRTNIVISSRSSTTDRNACMSVQLSTGDIRNALNLVDNPDNIGKTVFLKGDICAAYYGIPGIQSLTEFCLK